MIIPIQKIVEDGVTAPSGENCQPWKFTFDKGKLSIFNIPEADFSLYNNKQRGSYIAHGSLIENIRISALRYGYNVNISLFPDSGDVKHIADILFESTVPVTELLYQELRKRCTNRKDYKDVLLTNEEKKELQLSIDELGYNTFFVIDDDKSKKSLGKALAYHEKVLFENKKMHDFFYHHILWDKKDEEKAGGFFIDTLEFLPQQLQAVKLFKHWPLLTLGNKLFNVSTMISKENGEKYAQGGGFGFILMDGETDVDFVRLGMSVERLWLTASHLDVAVHPCNGTLYLENHINDSGEGDFSKDHVEGIRKAYADIISHLDLGNKKIGFIFRLGKAEKPTAVAKRKAPEIVYLGS